MGDVGSVWVQAIGLPAAVLAANGQILHCNDEFSLALKCPQTALLGKCLSSFFPEDIGARLLDRLGRIDGYSKTRTFDVEVPVGQYAMSLHPLNLAEGQKTVLCQLVPNLEVDSTRLRFLLDYLDQGIWIYNVLAEEFVVTSAWRRMRGFSETAAVDARENHPVYSIHPDDRPRVDKLFLDQIRGKTDTINAQFRYQIGPDEWRWFLLRSKVMVRDHYGKPVQIVGLDTDITNLKHEEREQLETASKLQLAVSVAGIGHWEFDPKTERILYDDRILDLYGITETEEVSPEKQWERMIHPEDRDAVIAAPLRALEDKGMFNHDYRIIRTDGETRHIRSAGRYVSFEGGAPKVIGVDFDVTEDYRRSEELEKARQKLERDSRHDALTGLANRRLLDETMQDLVSRLKPDDRIAVMHIDLDHFKQINDTLGHAAGDLVLVRVAENLRMLVGDAGLVCRIGGDEFVVLLESVQDDTAVRQLCQSIIDQCLTPILFKGHQCNVGLSIGCAIGTGATTDASDLFINADMALYAAKSDGRRCFRMFAPSMRAVSQIEASAHHDISAALANGEILCHFQPQFSAKSLAVVGAEALVRWNCPKRGLVAPDDFVPLAQATGLGAQMDEYVLDYVLAEQTRWAQLGLHVPTVALNISLDRLFQADLMDQLAAKVEPHHSISFELLETAFLDHKTDGLSAVLDHLRQFGIRIDLDDFGSGHSSVVALQTVRPDRVKIDKMLVDPLEQNSNQRLILEALMRVAELEGCGVVVEGIETHAQLSAMSDLKCEVLQGFLLGRPMSGQDFAEKMLVQQTLAGE